MSEQTTDNVNQPKHYCSHASGIECIQIAELLPFNLGSALKYLWRKGLKWDENEDVKKAIFYLRRQVGTGKLPTYTAQECSQIKSSLDCIKDVDLELWNICYIITLGTFIDWLRLSNKLEAGL